MLPDRVFTRFAGRSVGRALCSWSMERTVVSRAARSRRAAVALAAEARTVHTGALAAMVVPAAGRSATQWGHAIASVIVVTSAAYRIDMALACGGWCFVEIVLTYFKRSS